MCLPLQDPAYLQSHHLLVSPTKHHFVFLQTIQEVLAILNENFPSHVLLNTDDPSEQHRRHLSYLNGLEQEARNLLQDEVRDILFVLEESVNLDDCKGISICLSLLDSGNNFEFLRLLNVTEQSGDDEKELNSRNLKELRSA